MTDPESSRRASSEAALSPLKRAFIALEAAEARVAELERSTREPIAIIGMGCRVPGADDPAEFWRLLQGAKDAVGPTPAERWDGDALFDPNPDTPGRIASRRAGFLRGPIDGFDAELFGIAPREVQGMDPQQRLLLEVSWEALENAAKAPDRLERSPTGVYVGVTSSDYANLALKTRDARLLDAHFASGIAHSVASGRISYLLGLQGPSLTVDTACSSSLVAVHLACQALRSGDCSMALAGGVNLMLAPDLSIALSRARMLAPDGRCKTFDAAADGFSRGEGCGVVVLKRLRDAEADGDRVLAVIRGSAVNQDGPSGSLTAPNGPAQEAVIRQALSRAGILPHDVGYIEAHGTGTELGDPLEVQALGAVFGGGRDPETPLWLASVKTNIGHLEGAAGVVGLIKLVLSLRQAQIPAHLHFRDPSPHIPWSQLPFRVPTSLVPWRPIRGRRVAGVSSFGFSGTNAHVIVEEAPRQAIGGARSSEEGVPHLFVLSARSDAALRTSAARHAAALAAAPSLDLADACFTAGVGRPRLPIRAGIVARTTAELSARLSAVAEHGAAEGIVGPGQAPRDPPRIAFLFSGQGAQYAGMARGLYEREPVFRASLDRVAALLGTRLERPLLGVLFPAAGEASPIDETAWTQPALFAVQIALLELLSSWGVRPDMVIGHSVGELAAACAAGVMSVEDAAVLVAERGRLMQSLPAGGAMAAVFAPEARVAASLGPHRGRVAIAAVNAPDQTVVSGAADAVEAVCSALGAEGVRCKPLVVSHAFHSPLVDPILDSFERAAGAASLSPPRLPLVSNLTGRVVEASAITRPGYWRQHVRQAVRFSDGLKALGELRPGVVVEIGPQATLLSFAKAVYGDSGPALVAPLAKHRADAESVLRAAAALYLAGVDVDLRAMMGAAPGGPPRRVVDLPTYPFQRERFWFQAKRAEAPDPQGRPAGHPLLGVRLRTAGSETIFEARIAADAPSFVRDHRVQGRVIFPATAYLEALLAAGARALASERVVVTDVTLGEAMFLDDDGRARRVQIVCAPQRDGTSAVSFVSAAGADDGADRWVLHASAVVKAAGEPPAQGPPLEAIRRECSTTVTHDDHYAGFERRGLTFGAAFRVVRSVHRGPGEAVGEVELSEQLARESAAYRIHPVLLDGCLQTIAAALPDEPANTLYLPIGAGTFALHGAPGARCVSHAVVHPGGGEVRKADVRLFDADGRVVAELRDLQVKRVSRDALARVGERRMDDCFHQVVWRAASSPSRASSPPRVWLVLADDAGFGAALADRLAADGDRCIVVRRGSSYALGDGVATIDVSSPAGPRRLIDDLRAAGLSPGGVVHAWSVGGGAWEGAAAEDASTAIQRGVLSTLFVAQALVDTSPRPRLWIVTSGAQQVDPAERRLDPLQASVWGLARTLRHEHADLRCVCVDVQPAAPSCVDALVGELRASGSEPEVALRDGTRWVPRLVRLAPSRARSGDELRPAPPFRLAPSARGSFDAFERLPLARRAPGPGEVEIEVRATGLNFKDVLSVLGMYPGDAGALGGECAGTVLAVGAGVEHVRPGDPVLAVAAGSFASHVIARAELVRRRPDEMTAEEGASFPIAYLTAAICLDRVAEVRAGERVLVHAAAGGVGLAAVRVAQRAGAEVIATAGSPWKRDLLRSIGVKHVFDSRTPSFAAEIAAAVGEVDVVLNSLAGELVDASFQVLKPGGRFVEIGKRGIKDARHVEALGRGHAYHVVDWSETSAREPSVIGALLEQLVGELRDGKLAPLPRQTFSIDEASYAFRFMAQARHVGRIVVRHGPPSPAVVRADGTYVVTGGMSGLGLAVASWLLERGAGRVVLAGRRIRPESTPAVEALRARGMNVLTERLDVSDEASVQGLLDRLRSAGPPLRGIVHSAGVLDDAALSRQDPATFARVFAPKVGGAWLLDNLTRGDALDFFVSFSSVASILGSPGQANYSAANAFLDAFALDRRNRGLPALSVAWGAWAQVGVAAARGIVDRLASQGLGALTPEQGCLALERMLADGVARVAVVAADWPRYVERSSDATAAVLLAELIGPTTSPGGERKSEAGGARLEPLRERLDAEPRGRWRALVAAFVKERALGALGLEPSRAVDPQVPLRELGLDSLLAVELRNRLSAALSRPLPASLLFDCPTLEALTEHVLGLVLEPDADVQPAPAAARPDNLVETIEELSDDEVERQLAALAGARAGSTR